MKKIIVVILLAFVFAGCLTVDIKARNGSKYYESKEVFSASSAEGE